MAALTQDDLRDYVNEGKRSVASGYVLLDLKHNLTSVRSRPFSCPTQPPFPSYTLVNVPWSYVSRIIFDSPQRHFAEIQFHVDTEIEDVKFRLYSHTGTRPEFMQLVLHGVTLQDGMKLGAYGPNSHDVLEIIDHDPNSVALNGGLDDVSQVKRYVRT